MKGFLVKDARLIWHNKRLFLIMLVVSLFALWKTGSYSFIIAYITMIGILLAVTTISYDEYDKSIVYLMTMPAGRAVYVAGKYIVMFGGSLIGTALGTLTCIIMYPELAMDIAVQAGVICAVMVPLQLVMMPLQLKFGGEKGRMVLMGLLASVMVIAASLEDIMAFVFGSYEVGLAVVDDSIKKLRSMPAAAAWVFIAALCAALFALSFQISRKIVQKREF